MTGTKNGSTGGSYRVLCLIWFSLCKDERRVFNRAMAAILAQTRTTFWKNSLGVYVFYHKEEIRTAGLADI